MCDRQECRHSILFHLAAFSERDRHCIHPGCECPAYVTGGSA